MTKKEKIIRHISIGPLLTGGFLVMLALMIVLVISAIRIDGKLVALTEDIFRHPLAVTNAVRDANTSIIEMQLDMKDVALAQSPGELEAAITAVDVHEIAFQKSFRIVASRFLGDESMVEKVKKTFADWEFIRSEVIGLSQIGQHDAAIAIIKGKGARHVNKMTAEMNILIDFANGKADQFLVASKKEQEQSRFFLNSVLLIVLLIGGAIAIFVVLKVRNAEGQILQAMREAELANHAKSEFLSSMSHDLRTPLNAIIGFSEMMMSETFGPLGDQKYQGYSKDINHSGLLLVNMINDILDLSKIEAGRYEINAVRLALAETISPVLGMLDPQIEGKGLKITTDIPDDLPDLWCDQQMVMQILTNLLSNAVKFTEKNGSIGVQAYQNDDSSISLIISDDGIGMSEDELANVVEPFYRGNSHLARKEEGTGLGLHLCKKMAAVIDVTMDIKSGPHGTTVTLTFPKEKSVERNVELRLVK